MAVPGETFQHFIEFLQEPNEPGPVLSPRRFSQAMHIDLQTFAEQAHVHRNTISRAPGSRGVQDFLRQALRVIKAATDLNGEVSGRCSGTETSRCRRSGTGRRSKSSPKVAPMICCATSPRWRPAQQDDLRRPRADHRVPDACGGYEQGRWSELWEEFFCDWRELWFNRRVEPPSWVLADEALVAGAKGLLFASRLVDGGLNLVVHNDMLQTNDLVEVYDPAGALPKNQDSWRARN